MCGVGVWGVGGVCVWCVCVCGVGGVCVWCGVVTGYFVYMYIVDCVQCILCVRVYMSFPPTMWESLYYNNYTYTIRLPCSLCYTHTHYTLHPHSPHTHSTHSTHSTHRSATMESTGLFRQTSENGELTNPMIANLRSGDRKVSWSPGMGGPPLSPTYR